MNKLILAIMLVLSTSAFAGCIARGAIHLVNPPFTVYCQVNGKTLWTVTYLIPKNELVVSNTKTGNYWYFPFMEGEQYKSTFNVLGIDTKFTLDVGFMEDEHWVPVELIGN